MITKQQPQATSMRAKAHAKLPCVEPCTRAAGHATDCREKSHMPRAPPAPSMAFPGCRDQYTYIGLKRHFIRMFCEDYTAAHRVGHGERDASPAGAGVYAYQARARSAVSRRAQDIGALAISPDAADARVAQPLMAGGVDFRYFAGCRHERDGRFCHHHDTLRLMI